LSRWQKLRARMTEKVVVVSGGVAARADTVAAAGATSEARDRSLILVG
jgi:hypothetical protein